MNNDKLWRISTIVPVYNAIKYLDKCVGSLTSQGYRNIEIILVDDGSTDGSGEACDKLAATDARIKVIHKENGGLVSAWKAGVVASTGEYLSFLDSDDWVDTNMFEEMAELLTGCDKEIVASDYIIEKDTGEQTYVYQEIEPGIYDREAIENKVIPNLLGHEHRYITISRCMKLISRKLILDNIQFVDEKTVMGEDATIMYPALIDAERIVIMNHKAYYHYWYELQSMAHKYDKNMLSKVQLLRDTLDKMLHAKFTGDELTNRLGQLDQEYIFLLMLVVKIEARGNIKGYHKAILDMCKETETRKLIKETKVKVNDKSNKLLYLTMRHPNRITTGLLRLAMKVYYGKK